MCGLLKARVGLRGDNYAHESIHKHTKITKGLSKTKRKIKLSKGSKYDELRQKTVN